MSDDDGGFFAGFARSLVQRSLPAARQWMKERLGPGADVGQVELRGQELVVTGAKVPLSGTLVFEVAEATLDIDPDAVVSGGMPVRFKRATGRLVAEGLLEIPVSLAGRGGSWLDADLTATDGRWEASETTLSGRGRVVVGPDAWRLDDLRMSGDVESIEASASGARGRLPTTRLAFEHANAGRLIDTWQAIAGQPWRLPIPRHADVDGTVSFAPIGSRADLRLKSERSDLTVELAARPDGDLETLSIAGQLDLEELPSVDWISGGEPLQVRARLGGRMDALRGSLQLASTSVRSPWLREPVPFELAGSLNDDDAALHIDLGPAGQGRMAATFDRDGRTLGEGSATLDPAHLLALGLTLDAAPLEWTLRVAGTRTEPQFYADTTATQLTAAIDGHKLLLRRLKLAVGWVGGLEARLRARLGPGHVDLQRSGASTRILAERIDRDDLLGAARLAGLELPELPLPESTQLWADVTIDADAIDGELHAESERSRLTVAPLRSRKKAGYDGTRIRGDLGLADLPWLPGSEGRIAIEGAVLGPRVAPYVGLTIRGDEFSIATVPDAPLRVSELRATLTARRQSVELSQLSARVFGGTVSVHGARAERLEEGLHVMAGEIMAADLRDGLGAWLRASGVPVRSDPTLNLRCVDAGDGIRMQAHLHAEQTDLRAELVYADGNLNGSTLEGHAGLADFDLPFRGGRVALRCTLDGTFARPRATLDAELVEATSLVLGVLELPIEHAKAETRLSRERWVWSGAQVRMLGGRLHSRGVVGRDTGALGELRLEDLQVGEALIDGTALAERLSGTLEGTIRLTGGRSARGRFALHEPRYGLLSEAEPVLARWGLPVPALLGLRPLRLAVELDDEGVRVSGFEASVPGLRVRGDGAVDPDGALSGEVVLDAGRVWLAEGRSVARLGHMLGGITVPVHLGGHLSQLTVAPDLGAALRLAFERLFRDAPAPSPALPAHAPTSLLSNEALIARVADGGDDADDALDALLERGLSPEEIADRVAKLRTMH